MSFGFRKRRGIFNFSRRGVSASVRRRPVSVSSRGRVSLGWRSLFWRSK